MGAKPPPWTSEILFQGFFRPQQVLSPLEREKNLSPLDKFLNTPLIINHIM